MKIRLCALALGLLLLGSGAEAATPKIHMIDRLGAEQGVAKVNLVKGTVQFKAALAPLPATVDTGTEQFEATIYKAYLGSSLDATVEVPLGDVYPSAKGGISVKSAMKGDVSRLGLDRILVVAFSKDGLHSFDVLTGTFPTE